MPRIGVLLGLLIAGAAHADTVPDPFAFAPRAITALNATVESDPITVSGISAPAPIRVIDGFYRINNGAFVTSEGTVSNGDRVAVQLYGPPFAGMSASATLDIGGVAAAFTVTVVEDTMPDPMSFPAIVGAPPGVTFNWQRFGVSGINVQVPISIDGGEYSLNLQPFTSEPGTVSPFTGGVLEVRVTSPATYGETHTATLTIGGASAQFSVTTLVPGTRSSVLYYASQEGESIGLGRTWMTNLGLGVPGTQLQLSRIPGGGIHVYAAEQGAWYDLDLDAPGDAPIRPARYEGADRYPFNGTAAGLTFASTGRGCHTSGRFDVLEVGYAADGSVERLAVNFAQRCSNLPAVLYGQLRVNSTVPLGVNAIRRARTDLDGDTWSDALWRNSGSGENYLWPLHGTAVLPGEGYLRAVPDTDWQVAGTGDFDGNGIADLLWRNTRTGENYVYLMSGLAIAGEGYLRTVADTRWEVKGVGDFNGDGRDDILWRHAASGENYVYFMNGVSIAAEGYVRTVADGGWEVKGIGDFDGDGRADILWRHAFSGENYLYMMNGLSIANEGHLRTVADTAWEIKGVGDFDDDGNVDILWRKAASGENYVYFMNGLAITNEGYVRTVADSNWQIAALGDYDGDGKTDILWRKASTGENYLYPMDGTTIKASEGYLRSVPPGSWSIVGR
jgi:hypothetical protein